jgi:Zn-dependent alcohol dehydrogenase
MTNGGADYCFECIGSASLVHEAYACCRNVSVSLPPINELQMSISLIMCLVIEFISYFKSLS